MDTRAYKQKQLELLYAPYKKCIECPLGGLGRKNVVFGEGNPDAQLLLIGEGPGHEEDLQGRPFVGRAGKLLDRALSSAGINRNSIFITNIVKCRPPNNRRPTNQESQTCKKLLLEHQIKIIEPRIICTLGAAATEGLIGEKFKITAIRGKELSVGKTIIIPTLHPAYILRNPKQLSSLVQDIKKAARLAGG
jgi:uracil-DNA glycosylase family 4